MIYCHFGNLCDRGIVKFMCLTTANAVSDDVCYWYCCIQWLQSTKKLSSSTRCTTHSRTLKSIWRKRLNSMMYWDWLYNDDDLTTRMAAAVAVKELLSVTIPMTLTGLSTTRHSYSTILQVTEGYISDVCAQAWNLVCWHDWYLWHVLESYVKIFVGKVTSRVHATPSAPDALRINSPSLLSLNCLYCTFHQQSHC